MSPSSTSPPNEDALFLWLDRFLEAHPGGDPAELLEWAQEIPELASDEELIQGLYKLAEERRKGEDLLRALASGGQVRSGASFFGLKDKPQERRREPSDASPLKPGRRIGRFILQDFIARGGMGQVWVAEDTDLRRRVALKLVLPDRVDPHSLEQFLREARAGGRMNHPGLVSTLAYGTDDGLSWIAQELVEGSWTLKDFLETARKEERLPRNYYRDVAELVARIADGLEAAHRAGVLHRDLKPANILITEDDQPKIADFGLARLSDDSFLSVTGQLAGTWAYMSPEQVTAKRMGMDHRTDIFSLGAVMYELLTLRRPFEGDTTAQIAQKIVTADPPPATRLRSQCPSELAVIAAKALEKSPERRYASAGELADDLRRHLADEPILARPPGPAQRAAKWIRRHPAASLAGAISSVALVVIGTFAASNARLAEEREEQARIAMQSEGLARKSAAEAEHERSRAEQALESARAEAERAERERADVLRLSAQQDLADLLAEADQLWPPYPELVPELEAWLQRAGELMEELPRHREKLEELRALARPRTEFEREAERRSHPMYEELEGLRETLEAARLAHSVRTGGAAIVLPVVDRGELPSDQARWPAVARELLGSTAGPSRRAAHGVAIATEALMSESNSTRRAQLLATVAWGRHGLGDDDGALAAASSLEALGQPAAREATAGLREAIESARSETGLAAAERELEQLMTRVRELEEQVDARRRWSYEDEHASAGWWNEQLGQLISGLETLDRDLVANNLTARHGWSVGARLEMARALADAFSEGGPCAAAWAAALPKLRAAYPGLELAPQVGLLPLGPDPRSGLWEFAHLATGEPPRRDEDGNLVLGPETGVVLVLLPPGRFLMGAQPEDASAPNHDPEARADEGPVHEVELSAFFLSKFELNQAQWRRITGANPSTYGAHRYRKHWSRDGAGGTVLHPVEQVSWNEAVAACGRVGLLLPSEARWEYACRAGGSGVFASGTDPASLAGTANVADLWARANDGSGYSRHEEFDDGHTVHAPCGSFQPNAFGLHDMHGNVNEWCLDGYEEGAYSRWLGHDPVIPPESAENRSFRGGSYYDGSSVARTANRHAMTPDFRDIALGVRPAVDLQP